MNYAENGCYKSWIYAGIMYIERVLFENIGQIRQNNIFLQKKKKKKKKRTIYNTFTNDFMSIKIFSTG